MQNLHVHYGAICALADVNFAIGCGHCVGVLGPNGAGKSTLLKTIAGLTTARTGSIHWRGQTLASSRHEIAYLPQSEQIDRLFPLTVRGAVEMGRYPHLGNFGSWGKRDTEIVEAALKQLGLCELAQRHLSQLSGGQRQRVQIARALAQEAHILLLDEPFASLDEPSQKALGKLLRELASTGRLVLVCHHDLKMVPTLFDQVILLNRRMVRFGPVEENFSPEVLHSVFQEPAPHVHR